MLRRFSANQRRGLVVFGSIWLGAVAFFILRLFLPG
jgi:hypothetical protein